MRSALQAAQFGECVKRANVSCGDRSRRNNPEPLVRDLSSNITFAGDHSQSCDGSLLSFADARVGRSHRLASRPPDLARGTEAPQRRVSMSDSALMDTIKPAPSAWSHVPDELPGRRATLSSRARYWALGSAFATLTLGVMGSVSR